MAVALKPFSCKIVPYHALELKTKKVGHPYEVDMLVKRKMESDEQMELEESITTVQRNEKIVMIVEVKKSVSASFSMNEPNNVIELLIYCHYLTRLNKQTSIIGILTDGVNWHGLHMEKDDEVMKIVNYLYFTTTEEIKVIGTLPKFICTY